MTTVSAEKIALDLISSTSEDTIAAKLDPLGADKFLCEKLSIINMNEDVDALLKAANQYSNIAININNPSRPEALAVLRDLGFIAASLIKKKASPPDILSKALLLYGNIAEEVPRDTVFSYGPRNPLGSRRRKFTTLHAEDVFISSFVAGMEKNLDCLTSIIRCLSIPIESEEFKILISHAAESFSAMVDSMITVKKEIPPETFTYELRPYFDPLVINERKYYAPGGAQMPVILIDMLLWGKTSSKKYYHAYFKENLSYSPRYYRELVDQISELPSMLERILPLTRRILTDKEKESLQSLQEFLTSLVRFRHVHLAVAKANFALRESSDLGSGGYKVDILEHLLEEITDMRNLVKNMTMKGFFNMKNDFLPYKVGTVFNEAKISKPAKIIRQSVKIEYPTRLNAMAIDPSGITTNKNMVYTPGEVVIAVNLPRYIDIHLTQTSNEIKIEGKNIRKSLVCHAVGLMRKALNVDDGMEIKIESPHDIQHAGLGTSSGTISAVCAAINEIYGCPIKNEDLICYTAQNHGEEIDNQEDMLMPVQCIGGAASAGLHKDSILIITGESSIISSTNSDLPVIIGIPKDYVSLDSKVLMEKEIENLDKFLKTGETFRHEIAYEMLHNVLPAMNRGDISSLGNLVFNYRFNMGSIKNCSFVYPTMNDIADKIRTLHEDGKTSLLALSSVGPAFFALTNNIDDCKSLFEECDMHCIVTSLYNSTYRIVE